MIQALMLSFQSLSDRRVALVMVKVVVLTLVALIVSGIGLWSALQALFAWLNVKDTGFWSGLLSAAIVALSGILLFRAVAIAMTWVFADDIIDAVERVVGYNLLALPVYLLLLFTGAGTAIAFLLINALLLGKDMEDMLVARHGAKGVMNKLSRVMLGLFGTAGMMVPLVNLFVPVLATAMAVHLVHSEHSA